jgi:hypothetical protein
MWAGLGSPVTCMHLGLMDSSATEQGLSHPLLLLVAGLPWCGLDLVCLQLAAHEQVCRGGRGQGPEGQCCVMR